LNSWIGFPLQKGECKSNNERKAMNEKKYRITLTADEREYLMTLISKGKTTARTITRARVLLKAAASQENPGHTDAEIRQALDVGLATIYRIRQTFVEEGLDRALRPRKANREYQRKLNSEQEVQLIALACGKPPPGFARWTLRLLARRFVDLRHVEHVCPETVRQTLKKMS
jgi:transposase